MLGVTILLQTRQVPSEAIVQGAGLAWRFPVSVFEAALAQSEHLAPLLRVYMYLLLRQLNKTRSVRISIRSKRG